MSEEKLASVINLEQCKEIVNKFNREASSSLQAKSFSIASATEAKGFLGEYFHLIIDCINQENDNEANDNANTNAAILLRFFIKNLPAVDERDEKIKIFSKESSLYDSLLPKLQKYSSEAWCPKVYLCSQNILVLEDLGSRGLYSLATMSNLTEKEMLPVLNGLAAIHASSLLYEFETKNNIGNMFKTSLNEITVHPDVPWFTTGIKAIIEIAKQHSKYQTELSQKFILSKLPLYLENVYFMVNPSVKYRNVLCHRDPWGGNILLNRCDPLKPAVFVDFQTCRYSPAAIDVVLTLCVNLTKQERIEKQCEYIKYYYKNLVYRVVNHISSINSLSEKIVFSEADFLQSVEEFMLFGYVYRALALSVLNVPREFITEHYKNKERSKILLQYMQENKEFRRLMEESVEDIIEAVADISIKELN